MIKRGCDWAPMTVREFARVDHNMRLLAPIVKARVICPTLGLSV